jgi:hypothetical protein
VIYFLPPVPNDVSSNPLLMITFRSEKISSSASRSAPSRVSCIRALVPVARRSRNNASSYPACIDLIPILSVLACSDLVLVLRTPACNASALTSRAPACTNQALSCSLPRACCQASFRHLLALRIPCTSPFRVQVQYVRRSPRPLAPDHLPLGRRCPSCLPFLA